MDYYPKNVNSVFINSSIWNSAEPLLFQIHRQIPTGCVILGLLISSLSFHRTGQTEQQLIKYEIYVWKERNYQGRLKMHKHFCQTAVYKTLGDTQSNEFYCQRLSSGCIHQFRLHYFCTLWDRKKPATFLSEDSPLQGWNSRPEDIRNLRTSMLLETNVELVFYTPSFLRNSHRAISFLPPAWRKQIVTEIPSWLWWTAVGPQMLGFIW